MDVNSTRFHLLIGSDDWLPLINRGHSSTPTFDWDDDQAIVGLHALPFRFPKPPGDREPRPEDRRGAARDQFGHWYWIDEGGTEIHFLATGSRRSERFWSSEDLATDCLVEDTTGDFQPVSAPPPPAVWPLSGLAITEHHYLVVGMLNPKGLLIFDLHAGGQPTQLRWPDELPFTPFDMAPAPGGGVWILDRGERRFWALDRYFRVVTAEQMLVEVKSPGEDEFHPEQGTVQKRLRRHALPHITLEMSSPVDAFYPIAIEALPDCTVLILDSDPLLPFSKIYRYYYDKQAGTEGKPDKDKLGRKLTLYLALKPGNKQAKPFALRGHDMAFVPDPALGPGRVEGTLYIVASDGNQTFAFNLNAIKKTNNLPPEQAHFSLEPLPKYFPMRLFSGKGLISTGKAVYYDLEERWLQLAEQPQALYETQGIIYTPHFESNEIDCVWHRLFIDASIPRGTEILVESRAANSEQALGQTPWQAEPRLYLRQSGPEVPYYQAFAPADDLRDDTGTWELLFQHAHGRYLEIRLTLRGNRRTTPRLRSLRAYYPRFSYLNEYLPAAYRYDETSALFMDRYLANFEGLYTELEGRIAEAQTLIDVQATPEEYLEWLAGWVGVVLEPGWDEARRRLFITHAVELFRQRGTLPGLLRSIRLAIDPCPDDSLFEDRLVLDPQAVCSSDTKMARFTVRIVEQFLTRGAPGVVFGDPTVPDIPRLTAASELWTPEQGSQPLHEQYRCFLKKRAHITSLDMSDEELDGKLLSPTLPIDEDDAELWRQFTQRELGFTYVEVASEDAPAYREFLARRYQKIAHLNDAYQKNYDSFAAITLPGEADMPGGGSRLDDWIQFVSLVLAIKQNAYRFAVMVPIDRPGDLDDQNRQLAMVERIVKLEKPAHTGFEVRPYWAFFREGEARLGLDTVLGDGCRFTAVVLGQGYLATGYLEPTHPWNVQERGVAGRDRVGSRLVL